MILVKVSGGRFTASVDDEDAERVLRHTWYAAEKGHLVYALSKIKQPDGSIKATTLQQFIMSLDFPSAKFFDHIDGNGLNCTRANLRPATVRQNAYNRHVALSNTGRKGVHRRKNGTYLAYITAHKVKLSEVFPTFEEADEWRSRMEVELHGDFAFPARSTPKSRKEPAKRKGPVGVYPESGGPGRFYGSIRVNGELLHVSTRSDESLAIRDRDCAAIHYHGAKARLNNPRDFYTDEEIRKVVEAMEARRLARTLSKGVTTYLEVHYKVRAA